MQQLKLPALPENYFWRITCHTYAIPFFVFPPQLVLQLRKRTRWGWSRRVSSQPLVLGPEQLAPEARYCARLMLSELQEHTLAQHVQGDYA